MICRDAAELVSRELDVRLTPVQRLALGVHTLFCGPCRRFRKQMALLDTAFRQVADGSPAGDEVLSPAARARIVTAFDPPPDAAPTPREAT